MPSKGVAVVRDFKGLKCPTYMRQTWFAVPAHHQDLEERPDTFRFAHVLEEDGNILAIVGLVHPTREALDPPQVPPGGDGIGEDGLAGEKLLDLLVVYFELEDGRAHNGGPRLRLRRLSPLAH